MRAITISQYDGNVFGAPAMLEQFATHALTVVGNVFYSENRNAVSPEKYLHAMQAGAAAPKARVAHAG